MRTAALRLLCALFFVVFLDRSLLADEQENRARATLRRMESVATAIETYVEIRVSEPLGSRTRRLHEYPIRQRDRDAHIAREG